MHILLLAPQPFLIGRGTPIDVDLVVRALSRRGDRVDVATFHLGDDVEYPGMRIVRTPRVPGMRSVPPGFSWRKLVCDVLLFFLTWRLVRTHRYDVIHAGEESVFIARLMKALHGVPYVYDMDSSIAQQLVEQKPALRPLAALFHRCEVMAVRGAVAAAPVCEALADHARRCGARHVETLHDVSQLDAADLEAPVPLRERLGIGDEPIVMYVGNLEPYQGIDLLLHASRNAADRGVAFQLVIAGGTSEQIREYRALSAVLRLEDRVHFLGSWPLAELGRLLAAADVLTAPRVRGINTPMKVFPYLHSGRAVLVTDLLTHRQVLDERVALFAAPEAAAFGAAIARLVGDPALRARLGAAGRAFVEERHTPQVHQARVERLYDHVQRAIADPQASRLLIPHRS